MTRRRAQNGDKPSETAIQREFWSRFRKAKCADVIGFSVANEGAGGGRSVKTRTGLIRTANLKAMGLTSGVADFIVVWLGRVFFIEFKDHKGRQSESQRVFEKAAARAGAPYLLARSADQAMEWLKEQGLPLIESSDSWVGTRDQPEISEGKAA